MAKKKPLPKSPKQSASLDVWKRHEQKVKEVQSFNAQLDRDKTAKKALIARVRKQKSK